MYTVAETPLLVSVVIMYMSIKIVLHCVVPNNIHTCTKEGYWKIQGGREESQELKLLKENLAQNWNFQRDEGAQTKNPPWEGRQCFLEMVFLPAELAKEARNEVLSH